MNRRGQSSIEYLIIGAAILLLIGLSIGPVTQYFSLDQRIEGDMRLEILSSFSVGITQTLFSPFCSYIHVKNNELFPITINEVFIGETQINSEHLPLSLRPTQESYILTCDLLYYDNQYYRNDIVFVYTADQTGQQIRLDDSQLYVEGFASTPSLHIHSTMALFSQAMALQLWFEGSLQDQSRFQTEVSSQSSTYEPGPIGQAIELGLEENVQVAHHDGFGVDERSFAAWVYAQDDSQSPQFLVSQEGTFLFQLRNGTGSNLDLGFDVYSSQDVLCSGSISDSIELERWTHVGVTQSTFNQTQQLRFFIDGTLVGVRSCQFDSLAISTQNITLGQNFTGRLDEVGAWSRELTAQEMMSLYLRGGVVEPSI
ncbi:MAG: LamG domain-containing protein, partial [Candidatus Woesearchaeota archaeon]